MSAHARTDAGDLALGHRRSRRRCKDRPGGLRDRLVVGLNTDASARRLGKGPERPLNREMDRAAVIAALESVSMVTFFDEDTPVQLLSELRPQLYVKGGLEHIGGTPEEFAAQISADLVSWGKVIKASGATPD